jgi:hypothetical protein
VLAWLAGEQRGGPAFAGRFRRHPRSLVGFAGIPVRWPAALASTFGGRLRRRFVLAWLAGEQRGGPP